MRAIVIGIVGDFDRGKHSHWATEAALFHAAAQLGVVVVPRWIGTQAVEEEVGLLAPCDGIWAAPGSPYASMQGMLRAIAHAREQDAVFLGTCGGFQYALIELTRNVLGIGDADSAENHPRTDNIVITPVWCEADVAGGPRLCGTSVASVMPGTQLEQLCGTGDLHGEYFCSYETNARFVPRLEAAGLRVSARGAAGEMRA